MRGRRFSLFLSWDNNMEDDLFFRLGFDEGSDIDNWEAEQVFQDHEGEPDYFDPDCEQDEDM